MYVNSSSKLAWECEKGHPWEASSNSVKKGSWCPDCAGVKKKTIEDCHKLAKSRNGNCLSTVYVGNKSNLEWQCEEMHEWPASYHSVQSGSWCPYCAGHRVTIADCHKLAKSKNGKCLATEYVNTYSNLQWQCKEKHKWEASYNKVQSGRWCPTCSESKSEKLCRYILEPIVKKPFPKIRPYFLKTKKHKCGLELDGFCEDLNLAFEHQGLQHYQFVERFHKTEEGFKNQLQKDQTKRDLCEKNNVILIEIPAIGPMLKIQDVPDFIVNELHKLNFKVENPFKGKDIIEEYYKSF